MTNPGGHSYPAAQACRAHGASWYLPAQDELNIIWTNRAALDLASIGISTTNATAHWYKSSSQYPSYMYGIMGQSFYNGQQGNLLKSTISRIRCMRK